MPQEQLFSYNVDSGEVSGPKDIPLAIEKRPIEAWIVCMHLRPALATQLGGGAHIAYVTGPGSWSLIDLDVSLDRANASLLTPESQLPKGLKYWSNTDTHYPVQSGLSCAACRQTLSWPPLNEAAAS